MCLGAVQGKWVEYTKSRFASTENLAKRFNCPSFEPEVLRKLHCTDENKILRQLINSLTPKIRLLILPCSCYTFPCKLVMRT